MFIFLFLLIAFNIAAYVWVYVSWRKDCDAIKKEELAVPLSDRMYAVFLAVTMPCILGYLIGR